MSDDGDLDDPVDRSHHLDQEIWAIPAERVFTKKAVAGWFSLVVLLQLTLLGLVVNTTINTDSAVSDQIPRLERQLADAEDTIADQQIVLDQAVDAIVSMQHQIREMGGQPPEIILRPPED